MRCRLGLAVVCVVAVVGACHVLAAEGPRDEASHAVLEMPDWAPEDWLVVQESLCMAGIIAIGPSAAVRWDDWGTWTVTVLPPETVLGYECWPLELSMGTTRPHRYVAYLMRPSGLRLRLTHGTGSGLGQLVDRVFTPGPPWPDGDGFCFPVFPVRAGESRATGETELRRAEGTLVRRSDQDWIFRSSTAGRRAVQTVQLDDWRVRCIRVNQVSGGSRCVMRWLPGKPWWVQAWYFSGDTARWRWALAGSSWDTPPLDELRAELPETLAGWRRAEPEVIRIPEEGKALTSYTKTAQVAYTRGDEDLLIWFVPLRYDTVFEEAEEGSLPRTRTIHQAENYRVILWAPDDPAEADPQFPQTLREALAAYPKATLDEYPLPRAAPGGKILEDEPPDE